MNFVKGIWMDKEKLELWDIKANHVKIMIDLLIIKNKYLELKNESK